MYIRELIIEEFSGKCNEKITLENGFNLIIGANETGKSTVCAFIKFIFYGFADAKERERYSSIKTGNSSGAMIIEHDGAIYRIVRRASGRIQSVAVFDEESGTEVTDWRAVCETPGEYFLGIPASLYTRSMYVSQLGGPALDGGSAEAISNLLLTGDETLNLKRARKTLEEARKALKLKRGSGGAIYECETRISALKLEKEKTLQAKKELEVAYAALARENKSIAELEVEIRNAKNALELAKSRKIRAYLCKLEAAKKTIENITLLEKDLNESSIYNGFLPDSDYEKQISELMGQLKVYENEINEFKARLSGLQAQLGAAPPREYGAYVSLGKSQGIIPEYEKQNSMLRISHMAFVACTFLGIVCLIATLFAVLDIFKPNTFIYVLLGLSAIGAIAFGFLQMLPKKAILRLENALGATEKRKLSVICNECERYEEKISDGQIGYINQTLVNTTAKADMLKKALSAELSKWNKPSAEIALSDYRTYVAKKDALIREKDSAEKDASVLYAYLSAYTEEEVSAAGKCSTAEYTELDTASENELARLDQLLENAKQRKNVLSISIAGYKGSSSDIDEIEMQLEKEEELLSELNSKLFAITLAQSKLDEAEINIRRTVSPYLGEHSSKIFSTVTDGGYSALKLDNEMNLSYIESGADALISSTYFSAGSADLAWLCLRLALHKRLSENIQIPIILDEALVYFDDTRLKKIISLLEQISISGTQIIMLSASERELAVLSENANCIRLAPKR